MTTVLFVVVFVAMLLFVGRAVTPRSERLPIGRWSPSNLLGQLLQGFQELDRIGQDRSERQERRRPERERRRAAEDERSGETDPPEEG